MIADHNMHANLQARASEKQITEQAKRNSIQLAGKAFIAIAQLTANKREPLSHHKPNSAACDQRIDSGSAFQLKHGPQQQHSDMR
jgi:hypothetical protein